ncbi:hypothetical protein MVES1_003927 [Malassezia vespertilionis]|uniref:Uncharacterized protein n=1 Tax=Malassezia vespertilionis TaxID=2020962 RepID=A0A2N1J7W7_9BASI|nr:uncharacterized protein MVES1_003927 [Malassezia vespertilionis]PKI82633.1 hypothetical protein MVES_003482 [Malassezia vespertilionis]WFD08551.1 hypothetical protein MVES1_003927 [Malassezia vespertilionis]
MDETKESQEEKASLFLATLVPQEHDNTSGAALAAEAMRKIQDAVAAANGYIWHREVPIATAEMDGAPHGTVQISMRTNGTVEDEWFMTYILTNLTVSYPGLCVQVEDEDGEFLLIEAADVLPAWVAPANAKNRVWIYDGAMHLIPLQYKTGGTEQEPVLSIADAVRIVRDPQVDTGASQALQDAAFSRLKTYPQKARTLQHYTLAFLPISAANALCTHPQIVADAIHAISTRDVVTVRSLQRLKMFALPKDASLSGLPVKGICLVRLHMTRHLYAQLLHDNFFPPKAFGTAWQKAVEKYRLYTHAEKRSASITEEEAIYGRWYDLGAKLTAGLEMLAERWNAHRMAASSTSSYSLSSSAHAQLLSRLTHLGYFGDEVQGSARWNALEKEAVRVASQLHKPGEGEAALLWEVLHSAATSPMLDAVRSLLVPTDNINAMRKAEDAQDWLAQLPEELTSIAQPGNDPAEQTMGRLNAFTEKMHQFMEGQGDLEGALVNDELFEDGEEAGADVDSDSDTSLSKEERQQRMDALVPPLAASEWGAKNAEQHASEERKQTSTSMTFSTSKDLGRGQQPRSLLGFSSGVHYEGDSDSGESLEDDQGDEAEARARRYEMLGINADDAEDDIDAEIADGMDNFLEFTRKELGLNEEQYAQILADRREHGGTYRVNLPLAFVPPRKESKRAHHTLPEERTAQAATQSSNAKLDSFDAVLEAMEKELGHNLVHADNHDHSPDMEVDEELTAEDEELLQHLLASGGALPESLRHFAEAQEASDTDMEMLSNFLESFKAQHGRPGPVGTLASRLGTGGLPTDTDK